MSSTILAQELEVIGVAAGEATVELSHDLVPLLSEQLYRTPIKAIEELVVNSYDAGARVCQLFVPTPDQLARENGHHFIAVFDNGVGMSRQGLMDLWHVGRSPKVDTRIYKDRKQIGKFGIGKIATFTIASRLTYLTKSEEGILTSTLDFRRLTDVVSTDEGATTRIRAVPVPLRKITDWPAFVENERFKEICKASCVEPSFFEQATWTMALLENLKSKAKELKQGRLNWVLRTAMPLATDFRLVLNGRDIVGAKDELVPLVRFSAYELRSVYIDGLNEQFMSKWRREGERLVSDSFPAGISGEVLIFPQSIFGGKSDDLERSHGFFVRVRGRLVNLEDPLFGTRELAHKYFSRFRADVNVDDLDEDVKASREGVDASSKRTELVEVLRALFNDARSRYDQHVREAEQAGLKKTEDARQYVPARLVEHPIADVLTIPSSATEGADGDRRWFYLEVPGDVDLPGVVKKLYSEPRTGYTFEIVDLNKSDRLVKLDPYKGLFQLNSNHEFVRKHLAENQDCLEDIVIAEVLLEVYLREEGMPAGQVGEVLQRRDDLLRSLAKDRMQAPAAIAAFLRDSSSDQAELEIALIAAARALGFVAKHISNSDKPDGVARLSNFPSGDKLIILEAKSGKPKSHDDIDFATLAEHALDYTADGCLLVVPSYEGQVRKPDDNAIAKQARANRISCWTVEQLARVVESIEKRHISAQKIFEIVSTSYSPYEVGQAINQLFSEPPWEQTALFRAILSAMRSLETRMRSRPRSIDMITTVLSSMPEFADVQPEDVKKAVQMLAAASHGVLVLGGDGETVQTLSSLDEIERRVGSLIDSTRPARKPGSFRLNGASSID